MANFAKTLAARESNRILIPEFSGFFGFPDLISARVNRVPDFVDLEVLATNIRPIEHARILSVLKYKSPRTKSYLEARTRRPFKTLKPYIKRLHDAGLIQVRGDWAVSLSFALPLSMVDIVAYEGKVSDWRHAMHQAFSYLVFADSARVVMPMRAARRAKPRFPEIFRVMGLGCIGVDDAGNTRVMIRGRRKRSMCPLRHLMATGEVLTRFAEIRKGLDTVIRPESFKALRPSM